MPFDGMLDLWRLTWLLAISIGLLSFRSTLCRGFIIHGEMRTSSAVARLPPVSLLRLEVPKRSYTYFYLFGALHSIVVLTLAVFWQDSLVVQTALHVAHPRASQAGTHIITIQPHTIAFLALFSMHTTRRCLESLLVTAFGNAKMHVCIFFVGLYHYVATVLSILFEPDAMTYHELTTFRSVMAGLGLLLFLVASFHQSRCNYLGATQKRTNNMQHGRLRGDWFDSVQSPLYTTEIMLYVSFILVTGGTIPMLYLVSIWVLVNQILLAQIRSDYIETKFRDHMNDVHKWKLLPFIW